MGNQFILDKMNVIQTQKTIVIGKDRAKGTLSKVGENISIEPLW